MKKNFDSLVKAVIAKTGFYQEKDCTLVGFSGGADSTALLTVLIHILGPDRVKALHVNHHLRGEESTRDETFCRKFCEEQNIPLTVRHVDVNAVRGSQGVEEAARNARYAIFYEVAKAWGCETVSLAHNADDSVETMLFHLCRGAGLRGLVGIPVTRDMGDITIVRPLLDFSREEIETYLSENGIPHVEDSTNRDTAYTRNFIRHEIMPKLKEINGNFLQNARNTEKVIAETVADTEIRAKQYLQSENAETVENLLTLPLPVLQEVLFCLDAKSGGDSLSYKQMTAICKMLTQKKKGHAVSLSGDRVAMLDGNRLVFGNTLGATELHYEKTVLHQGENRFSDFLFLVGETPSDDLIKKAKFYKKIAVPGGVYAIRKKEDGDTYLQGGMTKKLKKCLCGLSLHDKSRPLVLLGDTVIWHPNLPHADFQNRETSTAIYYLEI